MVVDCFVSCFCCGDECVDCVVVFDFVGGFDVVCDVDVVRFDGLNCFDDVVWC